MIHSVAGLLVDGRISKRRPFRDPHHSASLPALVGGGLRAKPGEISLAHLGVLFLDELPEFQRPVLDSLRQPIESGAAVISVADNGVGLAPELVPRLFDMFAQADRSRAQGGLGIGLALSRMLVELHGGRIEAKSDGPGQGSEFVVRLPLSSPAKSEPGRSPARAPADP